MGHQNYTLQRQQCLNVQPSRIIATLTGIQVVCTYLKTAVILTIHTTVS